MADTDRELLEMAARAAGIDLYAVWGEFGHFEGYRNGSLAGDAWNPLTDDGDALRLAVKLNLSADFFDDAICVGCVPNDNEALQLMEPVGADPYAATRRAIVRAAAALGGGNG